MNCIIILKSYVLMCWFGACPGTAFGTPNWLRIVFATPLSQLEEAWDRIDLFCLRHSAAIPYTGTVLH